MVAYGFKPSFVAPIRAGTKRQTIRLPRRRHARPGEPVQLYVGLRTKSCAKIVPDPICVGVDEVRFDLRGLAGIDREEGRPDWRSLVRLEVNGIPIEGEAAEDYARGDGFRGVSGPGIEPFEHMVRWWLHVHGPLLFVGIAIRWEESP